MANITLPSNPVNGQTVTIGTRLFKYNSTTQRWSSRVFQVLGDTSVTVTNQAPTITASLSEVALDTAGANVLFTYTVSDVDSSALKVSHTVNGVTNSTYATVYHHKANNTVTIQAGTEEFSSANVVLTVTDGRNNASVSVDVSAQYALWTQQSKLIASDAAANHSVGNDVAIEGNLAVIGASRHDGSGSNAGSAFVWKRSGSTWTEQQRIVSSDIATSSQFGNSVDLSGDTIVVGNFLNDRAYVFVTSDGGSTWTQQAKIDGGSSTSAGDNFGQSVAIDGDTIVIGSPYEDNGTSDWGAVYVFTRSGSTWTEQAKIQPERITLGHHVVIEGDTLVASPAGGREYVFVYTRSGSTWSQQAKLEPSDSGDHDLGYGGLALDNNTLAIGSRDGTLTSSQGAVYVFTRSGSTWTEQAKIVSNTRVNNSGFASSVFNSIGLSGDNMIVGAEGVDDEGFNAGKAYSFKRSGTTWSQNQIILSNDIGVDDKFGASVAMSGNTAIITAYTEDAVGNASGSSYVFVYE